MTLKILIVPK